MARGRKKSGIGIYNRTAWIEHHQEVVQREKEKEILVSIVVKEDMVNKAGIGKKNVAMESTQDIPKIQRTNKRDRFHR